VVPPKLTQQLNALILLMHCNVCNTGKFTGTGILIETILSPEICWTCRLRSVLSSRVSQMAISVALPIPALRFSDYFSSSTPIFIW